MPRLRGWKKARRGKKFKALQDLKIKMEAEIKQSEENAKRLEKNRRQISEDQLSHTEIKRIKCDKKDMSQDERCRQQSGNRLGHNQTKIDGTSRSSENTISGQNNMQNDSSCSNGEVKINEHYVDPFYFTPLSLNEKTCICNRLSLLTDFAERNCQENVKSALQIPLQEQVPSVTYPIIGDGNCFFRALSLSLTGTQDNHATIRYQIVANLLANENIFRSILGPEYPNMQNYIAVNQMDKDGAWATELEIFSAAYLIGINIFIHSYSRWLQYSPLFFDFNRSLMNGSIYIKHCDRVHYEVVASVATTTSRQSRLEVQKGNFNESLTNDFKHIDKNRRQIGDDQLSHNEIKRIKCDKKYVSQDERCRQQSGNWKCLNTKIYGTSRSSENTISGQNNMQNDSSCSNGEVQINEHYVDPFYFTPLSLSEKTCICNRLSLRTDFAERNCQENVKSALQIPLQEQVPSVTYPIIGDGNCFFRALSLSLTGTQDNHATIRYQIVANLLANENIFRSILGPEYPNMQNYIAVNQMDKDGAWATELEIFSAAYLIGINIFIHSYNRWLQYSPLFFDSNRSLMNGSIYIKHCDMIHYEVVASVATTYSEQSRLEVQKEKFNESLTMSVCTRRKSKLRSAQKRDREWNTYHSNEDYRDNKRLCARQRFKLNSSLRNIIKKRKRRKYATNQKYRNSFKSYVIRTYKENVSYRINVQHYSIKRYAKKKSHRVKVKKYSITKYLENENHQRKVKEYSIKKYLENENHQRKVKEYSIKKYRDNPEHRSKVREYSVKKYSTNEHHRQTVKAYSVKKYCENNQHRRDVKSYGIKKYHTNARYRKHLKNYNCRKYRSSKIWRKAMRTYKRNKYKRDKVFSDKIKANLQLRYKSDDAYKISKIQSSHQRRKLPKHLSKMISDFKDAVKEGPDCVCCVCFRLLFRKQVTELKPFKKSSLYEKCVSRKYLHKCTKNCCKPCRFINALKLWICFTCNRKIDTGNIPPEAAINNLEVEDIPEELANLNAIECHLIALHIHFAKIVSLPKGGQFGVQGPTVCVPANLSKTTAALPRDTASDNIIKVKLKRKLRYKSHYKYQVVDKNRMYTALEYLKEHNRLYKDIELNKEWNSWKDVYQEEKDDIECEEEILGNCNDTCMQPVDVGQHALDMNLDKITCVAPGEGSIPVSMLQEVGNEAKAFPKLFPIATNTYDCEREFKLTLSRYFNVRLTSADRRWARSTDYLFYSQFASELYQVLSNISIALRKGKTNNLGQKYNAKTLTQSDNLDGIFNNDDGFKFLRPVRGTPAFWQSSQKDLFAMIRQIGIPTWFASFSSADMRWVEILDVLLRQNQDNRKVDELTWAEKAELLREDPVTVSRMFQHRFHYFLHQVILSSNNPIGKISDFFYRTEFQQRGSPHTHCLFWVENSPKLDVDPIEDILQFIDSYITCELPPEDDELFEKVASVQQHSKKHSKSCKKRGTACRFNFPRPASLKTFISQNKNKGAKSENKEAVNMLTKMHQELSKVKKDYTPTTKELFDLLNITQNEFEDMYSEMSTKTSVVLKRRPEDAWINPYNATLLRMWNGNLDLQFVVDAYSCVVYILSYISKSEKELSTLMEAGRNNELIARDDSSKSRLKKMASLYFKCREVSAQEAAYRVCNLTLKECSRKVQFIPVGDNCIRLSLPMAQLQKLKETDENSENVWMISLNDKYRARPSGKDFEAMCLAEFCSQYRVLAQSEVKRSKNINQLKKNLGYIKKRTRTKPAIVRYPKFAKDKQTEKYYQSQLQLFLPHRYDIQLKPQQFSSFEEFYHTGNVKLCEKLQKVQYIVESNRSPYEKHDFDISVNQIGESVMEDAWALICPNAEFNRNEELFEKQMISHTDNDSGDDIPDLKSSTKRKYSLEWQPSKISQNEAYDILRSMNAKQREIFYTVRSWCTNAAYPRQGLPNPFYIFLSGGAGTGKSTITKGIYYESTKIFSQTVEDPDQIHIVLGAPTGIAAFNIGAVTIHHLFKIPVNAALPYLPLSQDKLNSLRYQLSQLKILIIDEVSMVSQKLMFYIHCRLCQIKQVSDEIPFGGVSVLAVGDFFQLPPVKGKSLCEDTLLGSLWNDNFVLFELEEIMRQREDLYFAEMLNCIRLKRKEEHLLEDYVNNLKECQDKEKPIDALHIYTNNADVDKHNLDMIRKTCQQEREVEAEDFYRNPKTGALEKCKLFRGKSGSSLPEKLTLATNARVMLIRNICVNDGLVNGVFGTITGIVLSREGSVIKLLWIKFDDKRIGNDLRFKSISFPDNPQNESVPIEQSEEVMVNGITRKQFPIRLAWACTVHKVQGLSVNKAVVSFNHVFLPGQMYVALSRVRNLLGLVIEEFDESKIYCNDKIKLAMSNMNKFTAPQSTNDKFLACLLNIQCLRAHFNDLVNDKRLWHGSLVCLTETWLEGDNSSFNINGFKFIQKSRKSLYGSSAIGKEFKNRRGGGVGVYIKNDCSYELINTGESDIEALTFLFKDENIIISVVYRPPTYPLKEFKHKMHQLHIKLQNLSLPIVIFGDFNENILSAQSHNILKKMEELGYTQHVNYPTTEGNTAIDHIYTRNLQNIKTELLPTYYSYHNGLLFTL